MAGIGLPLERLMRAETVSSEVAARLGAMALYCGPWLFGTMAMAIISLDLRERLIGPELVTVLSILTYSHAGAMLIPSLLTLPVLRYASDRLYDRQAEDLVPAFGAAWVLHALVALLIGSVAYGSAELSPMVRALGIMILLATTQLWLAGSFASCLQDHRVALAAFVGGYGTAAVLAPWLGRVHGAAGYLTGCWIGVAVAAVALSGALLARLPSGAGLSFGFLRTAWNRPSLALVGFFLAAGCWVDKVAFWWLSERSQWTVPWMRYTPEYDATAFLGMLSALPGMAWTLLRTETAFANGCMGVVSRLTARAPHAELRERLSALAASMNETVWTLFVVQGPFTLLAVWYAPEIARYVGLPASSVHLLRFQAIGAVGLVMLQVHTLYLLYFDLPEHAMPATLAFVVLNFALAAASLRLGYAWWGGGFLVAAWIAAIVQGLAVRTAVMRLDHLVLRRFARRSLDRWMGR